MMRPSATFSFFIFVSNFFTFSHSSSLYLLVPPSSSSLFFPRPALSKSFRIRKSPFFIDFDESITDGRTNQPTNQPTDKASYRDADASKKGFPKYIQQGREYRSPLLALAYHLLFGLLGVTYGNLSRLCFIISFIRMISQKPGSRALLGTH